MNDRCLLRDVVKKSNDARECDADFDFVLGKDRLEGWKESMLTGAAGGRMEKVISEQYPIVHPQALGEMCKFLLLLFGTILNTALALVMLYNLLLKAAQAGNMELTHGTLLLDTTVEPMNANGLPLLEAAKTMEVYRAYIYI